MARGLGGFFEGFNQGYDTTARVMQDIELGKIAKAKAETSDGYTAEDGQQLEAMANAKDENGNPYYNVTAGEDGKYQVASNFQTQDASGKSSTPAAVGLGPRRVTDFMGKRYDGELTDDQVRNTRARASADVVGQYDPERGLRMRTALDQTDRDTKRFNREESEGALRTSALERQDRVGRRVEDVQGIEDSTAGFTRAQLLEFAGKANLNGHVPLLYTGTNKGGYSFMTTDSKGHPQKQVDLSEDQLRLVATGVELLNKGYAAEGIERIRKANKDVADLVTAMNAQTGAVVNSNNTSNRYANQDQNDRGRLDIARQELGLRGKDLDLRRDIHDRTNWATEQYIDEKGNVQVFDVNRTNPKAPDVRPRPMPPGMRPYSPRGEVTLTDREKIAYTSLMKELPNLPSNATPTDVVKLYRSHGLDPEKFGVVDPTTQLIKSLGGSTDGTQPVAAKGGLQLPLKNPTLAQLQAMSDEALAKYAGRGDHLAAAVARQRDQRANPMSASDLRFQADSGY